VKSEPSICFVIPYFGAWPFWLPFFLESCRANPTVNWLIYTDCPIPPRCPPNVRVLQVDYHAYCNRVSSMLRIDFRPTNAYKLCDLKPALGFIHREELVSFDFWAFGDMDVIYGDIRGYFTAERLRRKDLFATHERRISGHLCLIRNTERMRTAFMRIPDWQRRLTQQEHQALDEGAFSRLFIRHKNFPKALREALGRLNPWRRRSEFVEAFSTPGARVPWIGGKLDFPERWYWKPGSLRNDRDGEREFPYLHFLVWKRFAWNADTAVASSPEAVAYSPGWKIDASGFAESSH
jgi:hypothetical protein